jgi:hypothetical protein
MQPSACQHTTRLIQKLNSGPLEPTEEQHLATCPDCRDALEIRRLLLEAVPSSLPDRSALLWQQHTINKLLRREKYQSSWQVRLSMMLEIIGIAILAGGILIASRLTINWPDIFQKDKVFNQADRLLINPLIWGAFLVLAIISYLSFRFSRHKK